MDEQLIFDIWDLLRDNIPEKSRGPAADQFIDFLIGKDVETDVLEGLLGYDPHLDSAIQLVLEEQSENDEDEDYDEDYDEDDDEDY